MQQQSPSPPSAFGNSEGNQHEMFAPADGQTYDQLAAKMGISVAKLHAMQGYAQFLVRTNPGIKPKKVASKVAIKYNVKLV